MVFTRSGQCHWLKVWEIPEGGRHARGKPIVNLLNMAPGEEVAALVPVRDFSDDLFLFFCTRRGVVKKTALSAYGNIRAVGLNAINVRDGDELIDVKITAGGGQVILATRRGLAIRFKEKDVRAMGRPTEGVRGIALGGDDQVVGMVVIYPGCTLLVVTEHGMGKRSEVDEYRLQRRGGKGVINLRVTSRTGQVVTIKAVNYTEQLMVMSRNGVVNRQPVGQIRVIGRATQGVRLVNLDEGDLVMDVARVVVENGDEFLEEATTQASVGSAAVDEGDPDTQDSE